MKNLIFDLGNVIVRWDPHGIIENVLESKPSDILVEQFFNHQDWYDVDRGLKKFEDIISNTSALTNLPALTVKEIYDSVPASLQVIDEGLALLHRAKKAGYGVYALTNMGLECAEYLSQTYEFWHEFDGMIVSGDVHLIKPEPAIFELLIDKFQLNKDECVFIDDSLKNVEIANSIGIKSLQVVDHGELNAQLQQFFDF